jgi:rod shape determining protein RodA
MIVFAGFNYKHILAIALIFLLIFGSGWIFFFKEYQKNRILTFLRPSENSLDEGYNITQAIIAVGSGGLTGRGIGFGSQSQLKFLPEAQNDFIFAVIAEELGFLGSTLVIIIFGTLFFRLISSIRIIKNDFGIYMLLGITALLFIEMFINIGMNIGILPVVGISLPFLSYGGSAIISTMILIGIAENIIINSKLKY